MKVDAIKTRPMQRNVLQSEDLEVLPHLLLHLIVEGKHRLAVWGVAVLPREAWTSPSEGIPPKGANDGTLLLVKKERGAFQDRDLRPPKEPALRSSATPLPRSEAREPGREIAGADAISNAATNVVSAMLAPSWTAQGWP